MIFSSKRHFFKIIKSIIEKYSVLFVQANCYSPGLQTSFRKIAVSPIIYSQVLQALEGESLLYNINIRRLCMGISAIVI